jgi:hypothetical protein
LLDFAAMEKPPVATEEDYESELPLDLSEVALE